MPTDTRAYLWPPPVASRPQGNRSKSSHGRSDHDDGNMWCAQFSKDFNTEHEGRPRESHGAEQMLRFARSAKNPCSVALPWPSLRAPCWNPCSRPASTMPLAQAAGSAAAAPHARAIQAITLPPGPWPVESLRASPLHQHRGPMIIAAMRRYALTSAALAVDFAAEPGRRATAIEAENVAFGCAAHQP